MKNNEQNERDPVTVTVAITSKPIFVIGSPRSGTTALAASLQRHSQLWTSGESQILWDLFGNGCLDKNYQRRGVSDGSWLTQQRIQKATFLGFLGLGLNALFTETSSGKRWVDHTPIYTRLLPDLADLFPEAQFVHMLRDGRRVVHSMMHFLQIFHGDPKSVPWARDFREACRTWQLYVAKALAFERAAPHRCLTVFSEEMVAEPATWFAQLYAFLGIQPESEPIAFFSSRKINSSFGETSRLSVQRESRPWEGWTDEQRAIFETEAGELLAACRSRPRDRAEPATQIAQSSL